MVRAANTEARRKVRFIVCLCSVFQIFSVLLLARMKDLGEVVKEKAKCRTACTCGIIENPRFFLSLAIFIVSFGAASRWYPKASKRTPLPSPLPFGRGEGAHPEGWYHRDALFRL